MSILTILWENEPDTKTEKKKTANNKKDFKACFK